MAKSTVPVNFKDDIMNSSMGGKRRYKMINNSDGTISLEDATTYDQVGSNFGAAQLNATNQAVNAAADAGKIIDDLDAINNVTQEGYIAGALALKQVNSNLGEDENGMTVHEKLDYIMENGTGGITGDTLNEALFYFGGNVSGSGTISFTREFIDAMGFTKAEITPPINDFEGKSTNFSLFNAVGYDRAVSNRIMLAVTTRTVIDVTPQGDFPNGLTIDAPIVSTTVSCTLGTIRFYK